MELGLPGWQQHSLKAANILNLLSFYSLFGCLIKRGATSFAFDQEASPLESDFSVQLTGRRLTTAEVLYYMPGHPVLLQSFLWQTLDQAPDFPRIHRFLEFWRREIDAVIHSVTVSGAGLITPARIRLVDHYGELN